MPQSRFHSAYDSYFVNVHFGPKAEPGTFRKYSVHVFRTEEPVIAEYVNKVCQTLTGDLRNHFVDDEGHILVFSSGVCPTDGMRSKECGSNHCRYSLFYAFYHAEHLELILDAETIAALYLYCSAAMRYHFIYPCEALLVKVVFTCIMQQVGRVEDSSATGGYLFVAQAVNLVYEFFFPRACIYDVAVGIAERWHDYASGGIDGLVEFPRRPVLHFSETGDMSVFR